MKPGDRIGLTELRLDLTPLLGVFVVLLLFFMLSSSFVFENGIGITLPRAAAGDARQTPPALAVQVTRDGRLFIDGTETTIEGVRLRLRDLKEPREEAVVLIRADKDARHGDVVAVMGLIRSEGFDRLSVAASPPVPG